MQTDGQTKSKRLSRFGIFHSPAGSRHGRVVVRDESCGCDVSLPTAAGYGHVIIRLGRKEVASGSEFCSQLQRNNL